MVFKEKTLHLWQINNEIIKINIFCFFLLNEFKQISVLSGEINFFCEISLTKKIQNKKPTSRVWIPILFHFQPQIHYFLFDGAIVAIDGALNNRKDST